MVGLVRKQHIYRWHSAILLPMSLRFLISGLELTQRGLFWVGLA